MARSREQVIRLRFFEGVASAAQLRDVAGEGGRVARNVHHARRLHFKDSIAGGFVQTLARGVHHEDVNIAEASGGLTGVRAVKLDIFRAVACGVLLRVFDGLRHDLHADGVLGAGGERERDGACAAVQVEHGFLARQTGAVHRARIQTLGLRVVDLIEGVGGEQEGVAAQSVLQHRLAPEHVRAVAQNNVVAALVVVDEDAGERRLGLSQPLDKRFERGQLARRGNQRQLAFAAFFACAHVNMANGAAFGFVIVGRNVKFAHPLPHDARKPVGFLGLDQAVLHRHDVVAARTVEAGHDVALAVAADRILRLVAVVLSGFRTRDAEQPAAVLLADAGERVAHLFLLGAKLLLVGDVLIAAAAALVRHRTRRGDALARGRHNFLHAAERNVLCDLDDAHIADVPGRCARHEYRPSLDFRETRAVRRVIADPAAVNLVFHQFHIRNPCQAAQLRIPVPFFSIDSFIIARAAVPVQSMGEKRRLSRAENFAAAAVGIVWYSGKIFVKKSRLCAKYLLYCK